MLAQWIMARMARHLFLVAHQETGLYEYLLERFQGDSNVELILNLRREQRRRMPGHKGSERRHIERRTHREVDLELLVRSHVILTLGSNGDSARES